MRLLMLVLVSFLTLHSVSASPPVVGVLQEGCEIDALQINESTAHMVLSNIPSILDIRAAEGSDSVLLQLFLWGALEGNKSAIDRIGEIGIRNILKRGDDALIRLLWILAQNDDPRGEYSRIVFSQNDMDALNKWANQEVRDSPKKLFTAMMYKARRFGGNHPSLSEFQNIDIKVRDPEVLFYMAGLISGEDEYREKYTLLKESAEGGEWRSFLGLALIEKSELKNCSERAQISYRIFSSIQKLGESRETPASNR